MKKIKTTHVGSLPRPDEMMAKLRRKEALSGDDLRRYLKGVMERQLSLGITAINNGELPRMDYVRATVDRISGFGGAAVAPIPRDMEEMPEISRRFGSQNGLITLNPKAPVHLPACLEPLAYTGEASLRDELEMMTDLYAELKPSFPDADTALFFTAPSPGTVALFLENQYYPDDEEYLTNIADVLQKEYETILGYGVQLQIDCPDLAMGRHTRYKHLTDDQFVEKIDANVRALNHALEFADADQCRVHICWGNYPGTHHRDIGLREIFNSVMAVNARFISLESCNHRHGHEWALFREFDFPEDKVLMPGVIDTGSNTVEHPDLVAMRLSNFINILGADRVIGSTDCGFATTATATSVSGETAWLKLASLVEGAKRAGGNLG